MPDNQKLIKHQTNIKILEANAARLSMSVWSFCGHQVPKTVFTNFGGIGNQNHQEGLKSDICRTKIKKP